MGASWREVPFVLHSLNDAADGHEAPAKICKIIGDCYLDGFIDG